MSDDTTVQTAPSRIVKMLELSTGHVPEHIGNTLDGLGSLPGVIADKREYGWFMWVPDDVGKRVAETKAMDDGEVPPEIVNIWRFARRLGCDWVMFDCDADSNDNLPFWAW